MSTFIFHIQPLSYLRFIHYKENGSGTEMIFSQNLFRRPTPARLTRIEKSLLQAHFRSVNYCQYNFVEHRTLIYVPA
ncbi:Hypothetical Protein C248_0020 [Staphylococcus aureus 08BA02176]|nr:Hypothetical Protein C248_0020 [Staphylococcus aureus 08BA02176]